MLIIYSIENIYCSVHINSINTILIPFPFIADLPVLDVGTLGTPEYIGAWW